MSNKFMVMWPNYFFFFTNKLHYERNMIVFDLTKSEGNQKLSQNYSITNVAQFTKQSVYSALTFFNKRSH